MRRFFLFWIIIFVSVSLWGQKEVTTFMDIPIDGPVVNMIDELEKKGFRYIPGINYQNQYTLEGLFNGDWAKIVVSVYKDKVFSVGVIFQVKGVENAKLRFNSLHVQMAKNWKYYNAQDVSVPFIADDVDVEHELQYGKTDFSAVFFQVLTNSAQVKALKEYKKTQGGNPDNLSIKEKDMELYSLIWLNNMYEHTSPITEKYNGIEEMDSLELDKFREELLLANEQAEADMKNPDFVYRKVSMALKRIMPDQYAIYMVYMNLYNIPNGEDL